ncbi:MAG: hypothetical protein WA960_10315 [Tunicatimonas sp.]
MIDCAAIAHRNKLPVYVGNSPFELSVHAAVAFDVIDRIEFADLGWNKIVEQPVRFENGWTLAPVTLGHGFVPSSGEGLKVECFKNYR